jgi:hypothetical protein
MRLVAGTLSAGGALVSILSYTGTYTPPPTAQVHRLTVTPAHDTAAAIGDSLQLAALVTDIRGAALLGVAPSWTSGDPRIATVDQAGTVLSRAPGSTDIIVRIGELEARARIAVVQRPAELQLLDTLLAVSEGERRPASVEVGDARGNPIAGAAVRWETADAAIAAVDSAGEVTGVSPGRSALTATFGQLRAALPVVVLPVAASITIASGEDQRAPAGRTLPTPVVAQVVSRTGRPMTGVPASFVVRGGLGAASPEVDTSDARGMVQSAWTLGPAPGRQQMAISVEGVAISPVLTAEADPQPANTRVVLAAEGPKGVAGDSLAEPVLIRVTDSAGAALPDVPVAWITPDGGAAVPLGPRTDSLGEARARWTLGPRAGRQRLRVQVGNARSMPASTVAATALPGEAVSMAVRAGDRQTGPVGKALAHPILVRAVDRHGNGVADVTIRVAASSGRVADSVVSTDSTGQARIRWTLGLLPGVQRVTLRLRREDTPVEAVANARPGSPARLAFVAPPATATVGRAPGKPLMVEVTDAYGNPVPDRTIGFTATSGKLSSARATTDTSGRATVLWTPGGKAGAATLVAKVAGSEVTAKHTLAAKVKPRPAP